MRAMKECKRLALCLNKELDLTVSLVYQIPLEEKRQPYGIR